jgi:hypothetical protein
LSATKPGKPSKPKPPPNSPNDEQSGDGNAFDDVLKRMLATPPAKHASKPRKTKKNAQG